MKKKTHTHIKDLDRRRRRLGATCFLSLTALRIGYDTKRNARARGHEQRSVCIPSHFYLAQYQYLKCIRCNMVLFFFFCTLRLQSSFF